MEYCHIDSPHCGDTATARFLGFVLLSALGNTSLSQEINNLVESVSADGLFIHVNHLQEAVQPEGDLNFENLYAKLEKILPHIKVPVIVKEVGHGMDRATAQRLYDMGVKYIDVAGVGGSSWAWIEGRRQNDYKVCRKPPSCPFPLQSFTNPLQESENMGYIFRDVGVPTDVSLIECRKISPQLKLVASGGLRNGLDMAKAVGLGADYVSCAKPFLKAAMTSPEAVVTLIRRFKREMAVALFASGAANLAQMKALPPFLESRL